MLKDLQMRNSTCEKCEFGLPSNPQYTNASKLHLESCLASFRAPISAQH